MEYKQPLAEQDVIHWIGNGPSPETIEQANRFGKDISKTVTRSQIRQIFTKLKSIEAKGYKESQQRLEFMMLKPYIAYAAGRHKKLGLNELKKRLDWGIDAVLKNDVPDEKQRFKNFCRLFEAILAYHRAHGGS
jgi:CRISPR-associated protein Csm2